MPTIGPFGFSNGLNTSAFAPTLGKDQLSDAQDVLIINGDVYKRQGSVALNASAIGSAGPIHGLYDWQSAAGQRYLIATAGTKIYNMTDLGGTFTDVTGAVAITSGQNQQHTFSSLNNVLVACAPTDVPISWSATGNFANLAGSPPTTSITTTVNNFMFLSGNTTNPSRVYWSNASDPTTWGASNFVDFRLSDGDKVTALAGIGLNLYIFKRRSIGQLSTLTQSVSGAVTLAPLTEVIAKSGCVGPLALDRLPDGRICFFGTNAHVYIFDGVEVQDISDRPFPASNIQTTLNVLSNSRFPYINVRVYPTRNEIWISYSSGTSTTNDKVLVYNYKNEYWESVFTGIAANVMTASIDSRSSPQHQIVMITGNYTGTAYEQDRGNVNGEATNGNISGYANMSIMLDKEETDFIPRAIVMQFETQTNASSLNINYGFDGYNSFPKSTILQIQAPGAVLDQFILDVSLLGTSGYLRTVKQLVNRGRSISAQVQFQNFSPNQPFQIHPFYLSDEVPI